MTAGRMQKMSVFCTVDDKHIPLYRIMWVSALPHFADEVTLGPEELP